MSELFSGFLNVEEIFTFLHPEGAAYLFVVFLILITAKFIFDLTTPYKINNELTSQDNKAVATSFAGYLLAVAIIVLGVFSGEAVIEVASDFYRDLLDTLIWGIIGIVLLQFARLINDKLLLRKFDNVKELITDRNIGTGAVEFGSYIGSALIIFACIQGEDISFWHGLVGTLIYFVLGQLGFILFGMIYQWISRYDLHAEIEQDNVSAGVAFGLSMIAIAILLSGYILRFDSLPGFAVWFVMSLFFLVVSRYLVDKLILPGALLDEEISKDRNWGAALVEGGVAIGFALLLVPAFLS